MELLLMLDPAVEVDWVAEARRLPNTNGRQTSSRKRKGGFIRSPEVAHHQANFDLGQNPPCIDALNTRRVRMQRVMEKAHDTEMALGSDVMVTAAGGLCVPEDRRQGRRPAWVAQDAGQALRDQRAAQGGSGAGAAAGVNAGWDAMKKPRTPRGFFWIVCLAAHGQSGHLGPVLGVPRMVVSAARERELTSVVVIRRRSVVFIRRFNRFVAGRLQVPGRCLCCPPSISKSR